MLKDSAGVKKTFQHATWASSSQILLVLHEVYDLVGK